MTLADRIATARKAMGYTQLDLAKVMGFQPTTISGWERGRNEPSIGSLKKLTKVLNVSFEYLVGLDDKQSKRQKMSKFSKCLTKLREKNGWSKTETANRLKLPLTTYANYEYGDREPNLKMLCNIADVFNVTTDELLDRKKPVGIKPQKPSLLLHINNTFGTVVDAQGNVVLDLKQVQAIRLVIRDEIKKDGKSKISLAKKELVKALFAKPLGSDTDFY